MDVFLEFTRTDKAWDYELRFSPHGGKAWSTTQSSGLSQYSRAAIQALYAILSVTKVDVLNIYLSHEASQAIQKEMNFRQPCFLAKVCQEILEERNVEFISPHIAPCGG